MEAGIGFDLKALEVFVAIVETGSMTASGQRLGLTQSSISQIVANLEQSLHVQLLDRSQRPVMVTPLGRQFYDQTRRLLDGARQISREFQNKDRTQLKQVRIAIVDSLATCVGKELLDAVKQRTAQWSLVTGQWHAEALLARKVDILITDDPVAQHCDLYRYRLVHEPFVLILPAGCQTPGNDLRSLMSSMDFIAYGEGSVIGDMIANQFRQWGINPPVRVRMDNNYSVISAVEAGIGWAITTPLCILHASRHKPPIQILPLPNSDFCRELTLIAYHNELGNLPRQLAEDTIELLRTRGLPLLRETAPWVLAHMALGKAPTA
jgi:DNA-binding transcriptional LysR family regulator